MSVCVCLRLRAVIDFRQQESRCAEVDWQDTVSLFEVMLNSEPVFLQHPGFPLIHRIQKSRLCFTFVEWPGSSVLTCYSYQLTKAKIFSKAAPKKVLFSNKFFVLDIVHPLCCTSVFTPVKKFVRGTFWHLKLGREETCVGS